MKVSVFVGLLALLLIVDLFEEVQAARVQYQFKKYTYRKKRDDKIYKNTKQPCEVNPDCLAKRGADQAICIRNLKKGRLM
ncbi:hypothetical protein MAR_038429 [Mya arenaria]|uniref:Secreted protein n=1 Tax=Mya arenaria TaxID=6604 RepID=A0ABY7FRB4_MYAAR|nr:hypothetical protein MAR_038429 [Mya arenaria]